MTKNQSIQFNKQSVKFCLLEIHPEIESIKIEKQRI